MTKDRALRVLDVYASVNGSGQCTQDEFEEAKKMAIEALESQDRQVIIAGSYLLEGEDNVPDTNVGDTISRQAAIDAILKIHPVDTEYDCTLYDKVDVMYVLKDSPPVNPQEPKIGHWIENAEEYYKAINEKGGGVNDNTPYFDDDIACSECLAKFSIVENEVERFDYCPNCGAKMIEPQESEKINCKTTKSESIKKMRWKNERNT